jgi:hypothetical protein
MRCEGTSSIPATCGIGFALAAASRMFRADAECSLLQSPLGDLSVEPRMNEPVLEPLGTCVLCLRPGTAKRKTGMLRCLNA